MENKDLSEFNKLGDIIFHGSPLLLKEILPKPSYVLGFQKAVFAGPRWLAVAFLGHWRDKDIAQGTINGKPYMKEMKKGIFKSVYKSGGYLHHVINNDNFVYDERLAPFEKISFVKVKPVGVEFITDVIKELETLGVDIIYKK